VFWSTYTALLVHVALARDQLGNPNFEANKITRLYEECIQAASSTRWVWALTFASANEALAGRKIAVACGVVAGANARDPSAQM
jgi:hypothetical protein